ncbi:MAG: Mrp/NBP35 family ATP-binding protein [Actinobacteria bacterium]|nr:Mrp/NBP35 family ATP-binding protein [Actinomycetota bacterium]MBU1865539.1 Mrp/NBP35 family ATP-binding protein [Actinomycetota bacterium]
MIDGISATAKRTIRVDVAMPAPGWLQEQGGRAIADAVKGIGSVSKVDIETTTMSDDRRDAMLARIREGRPERPGGVGSRTRVISVASGKGGVGKSSVTANTAVALTRLGHDTAILDADVWGFSIPRMLGIEEPPAAVGESMIIAPAAHGVRAMSMDFFVPTDRAVVWRGPMLHKALEQFLGDVYWDEPDFLLIDMPPGTGDVAISLSQFLPRSQTVVVTTPQPTAQRVARRAALMASEVDQEIIGIVENMSWFTGDDGTRYPIFGEGGGAALAADLGVPLLGTIPLLPALREGADRGEPVAIAAPDSEAAAAFEEIAARIVEARPRVRSHPELVIS